MGRKEKSTFKDNLQEMFWGFLRNLLSRPRTKSVLTQNHLLDFENVLVCRRTKSVLPLNVLLDLRPILF
jgi:hypothetical protein